MNPQSLITIYAMALGLLFIRSMGLCSELMVEGNSFKILATQEVKFVPLKKSNERVYKNTPVPRKISLKSEQSSVKNQGQRGSCTYFVMAGLLESLVMQKQKTEIDISEEYIAWASKVKNKLRADEEDSSVAVNASTIQKFGFMLEGNFPYQRSWFDQGMPCEMQRDKKIIDPICYSHKGPSEDKNKIIDGSDFIFEAIDSGSHDVVLAMARLKSPVTASIQGHPLMWKASYKTGELVLTRAQKKACTEKKVKCSAHAVLIVGYDLDNKIFHFKNSWGAEWGDKGYGTIPFDYMDQMSARKFMTASLSKRLKL